MKQSDDWNLTETVAHRPGRGDPFAAAIRGTRMPIVITDARQVDNPIVFANEAFQMLTGYGWDEIIGRNCRFLQGKDSDAEAIAAIRRAVVSEEAISIDLLNYRKDGSIFWNALYLSPVRNKDGAVHFFFASQLDVTDRVEAQRRIAEQKAMVETEVNTRTAELEAALEAKTTLLHEVDHRVKNNLTMIGALLRLQSRSLPDPKLRATLENMLERVDALATVHRRLYQSADISRFDIGAFAKTLVTDIIGASGRQDIRLKLEIDEVLIPANKASPAGLIIDELVTNAVKHAYLEGRSGELSLQVRANGGLARIEIADDGPGFDVSAPATDSIGRSLVERLSRQIRATTRWNGTAQGTVASVSFPIQDQAA